MNKQEFLGKLRSGLSGLPQGDVEERLTLQYLSNVIGALKTIVAADCQKQLKMRYIKNIL